jgi:hypothetical protein
MEMILAMVDAGFFAKTAAEKSFDSKSHSKEAATAGRPTWQTDLVLRF